MPDLWILDSRFRIPNSEFRIPVACVASVPVRSERNSGRAKESFGSRVKNGARAKRWKEGGGGGERRERLPANPSILKNAHWFSRLSSLTD